MSDHNDRRRARRGTGPRRGNNNNHRDTTRGDRDSERETTPSPAVRPIILAKPDRRDPESSANAMKQVDAAIIMVKTRDDSNPASSRPGSSSKSISPSESYRIKTLQSPSPVPISQDGLSPQFRLSLPAPMSHSVKVVDETFQWSDTGLEFLLDQTDYFVIGVVGLENSGKSTIMSLLAGSGLDGDFVFKPACRDNSDLCSHQTVGMDMYVTSNRIIFLDTQPVLSTSVLDSCNRSERKFPGEYSTSENMAEIQSLQMTAFLYTVCNVVLVVQDWFADTYFLKFLMTSEMLRPSIPCVTNDTAVTHDEFLPHIVMVVNKSETTDFNINVMNSMIQTVQKCFEKSKLRYQGNVTMATGVFPNLTTKTIPGNVNIFLLPWIQDDAKDPEPLSVLLPEYKGHPGFEEMLRLLRNQLFQLPRQPFTNAPLTERNWFHYAARMWETVKKSQLFADYSRLLP